ncbi:Importin 9 [Pelomyxa schiedti]|nr:Importin 9 [Pelomyxa schiedti]
MLLSSGGSGVLLQVVGSLLSDIKETRNAAEEKLHQLEKQNGFGVELAVTSLKQDIPVPARQMAAIVLKNYVRQHWDSKSSKFVAPPVESTDKQALREILPFGLGDPESKIRTAVSMVMAQIAQWDWPSEWPTLLSILVEYLRGQSTERVKGAIRCLDMFVTGDALKSGAMPTVIDLLFPELLRLFVSPTVYDNEVRVKSLLIIHSCLQWLSISGDSDGKVTSVVFGHNLPTWVAAFAAVLPNNDPSVASSGIKMAAVNVITLLITDFESQIGAYVPQIAPHIWAEFLRTLPLYEFAFVHDTGTQFPPNSLFPGQPQASAISPGLTVLLSKVEVDGESYGLEEYVIALLECLCSIASSSLNGIFKNSINELVHTVIGYMQITSAEVELWCSDLASFIMSNSASSSTLGDVDDNTVRSAAVNLLKTVTEMIPDTKDATWTAINTRLQQSNMMKASRHPHWWKVQEASISALCIVDHIILQVNGVSVTGVLQYLLSDWELSAESMSSPKYRPILFGCSLFCITKFCIHLCIASNSCKSSSNTSINTLICTTYIQLLIGAYMRTVSISLKSGNQILSVFTCKALTMVAQHVQRQLHHHRDEEVESIVLLMFQPVFLQQTVLPSLVSLLDPSYEPELLCVVLQTVLFILEVNKSVAAWCEPTLTRVLVGVWYKHSTNPLITLYMLELFELLCSLTQCHSDLMEQLLPVVLAAMALRGTLWGVARGSTVLLTRLIEAEPQLSPLISHHVKLESPPNTPSPSSSPPLLKPSLSTSPLNPSQLQSTSPPPSPSPPPTPQSAARLFSTLQRAVKLLEDSGDTEVLQAGAGCMRAFIHKIGSSHWNWEGSANCLQSIVNIVAMLLYSRSAGDASAAAAAPLVSSLMLYVSDKLGGVSREMFIAMTKRLPTIKSTENLLPVLGVVGELLFLEASQVMQTFKQIDNNCLQFVATLWVQHHHQFRKIRSPFALKKSILGLAKLFGSFDESLMTSMVEHKCSAGQATKIPLALKLLKILLLEHRMADPDANITLLQDENDTEKGGGEPKDSCDEGAGEVLTPSSEEDDEEESEDEDEDLLYTQDNPIFKIDVKKYLEDMFVAQVRGNTTCGVLRMLFEQLTLHEKNYFVNMLKKLSI